MPRVIPSTLGLCVLLVLLVLTGCVNETTRVTTVNPAVNERAVVEAPAELHDIAGYLLEYRALNGHYPPNLASLVSEEIMPVTGYPQRDQYAYSAFGLGYLEDGRRIMLVDASVRAFNHLWCIVEDSEETAQIQGGASLAVVLVSMDALEEAAQAADRR